MFDSESSVLGKKVTRADLFHKELPKAAKVVAGAVVGYTGVDALLYHSQNKDTLLGPFWDDVASRALLDNPPQKNEIEQQFNVRIYQPKQPILLTNEDQHVPGLEDAVIIDLMRDARDGMAFVPWDDYRLGLLRSILSMLPQSFYANPDYPSVYCLVDIVGREEGRLKNGKFRPLPYGAYVYCNCNPDKYIYRKPLKTTAIVVNRESMHLTSAEALNAEKVIAHESTHYRLTPFDVVENEGFEVRVSNPIVSNCLRILGVDLVDENIFQYYHFKPHPVLLNLFRSEVEAHYFNEDPNQPISHYTHKSQIGYGALDPGEFIPVATESYILGKRKFIETYRQFVGEKLAEKLYEYMRDVVFETQEYAT